MGLVYRIVTSEEWCQIERAGRITPSPLDQRSGFMHLSGPEEVLETCARYFKPASLPVACEISAESLGEALRWEVVHERGDLLFPHFYGEFIALGAVNKTLRLVHMGTGRYRWGTAL